MEIVFSISCAPALTLEADARLVKAMKITKIQMNQLSRVVIDELKASNQIVFKAPEEKVYQKAFELVQQEFQKEEELDREVYAMMDELEKSNADFERYKMFPLLKKRLAKEKGVVL